MQKVEKKKEKFVNLLQSLMQIWSQFKQAFTGIPLKSKSVQKAKKRKKQRLERFL